MGGCHMGRDPEIKRLFKKIEAEIESAIVRCGPINSHYEAYGLIMNRVCGYWDGVRMKGSDREGELIQIATMAIRTLIDLRPSDCMDD